MRVPRQPMTDSLRRLAMRRGIQLRFVDTMKRTVVASEGSVRAVLRAMGDTVDGDSDVAASLAALEQAERSRLLQPVIVCDASKPLQIPFCREAVGELEFSLQSEDGASNPELRLERDISALTTSQPLPAGYYDLTVFEKGGEHRARVLVAPRKVFRHQPIEPRWGVFAPLYAIRGSGDPGIGTYADLRELIRIAAAAGASCVGTLPLYSTFLDTGFDPSPYAPVSRLFWNEAHLTLSASAPSSSEPLVDWREVARRKLQESLPLAASAFADENERAAIEQFEAQHPMVRLYAAFRARVEEEGRSWRSWSEQDLDVDRWSETPLGRWYRWAQMRCESEIRSIAEEGIYLDFPLGSSPDGFDVWFWRDLYVDGASIGAPPDLAYRQGQDWGFRPPHPETMRIDGWRHWRDLIRRAMEPASMLRLDHVMGLHRMWWVPAGRTADHGLYVHYAAEELYAILAIESHRASCTIIGEDLGTVPPAVTRSMKQHGVLGMWALERQLIHAVDDQLAPIGADRVASIGTHDMPPFAAFVEGSDIEEKGRLGVIESSRIDEERTKRPRILELMRKWIQSLDLEAPPLREKDELLETVLVALASSRASWLIINLEDLWLETTSQNIPTTTTERPNWRPRLKLTLDEIRRDSRIRRLLARIAESRRSARSTVAG